MPRTPRQKATVKSLATDHHSINSDTSKEESVITRLKRCLDKALHPNTNESEAKSALILANRMMEQHNIAQSDLLSPSQAGKDGAPPGSGSSVVSIHSTRGENCLAVKESYVGTVALAIRTFFDCKSYSTKIHSPRSSIEWTFYGIAENTVAAAMAFEMVHSLIAEWALNHHGKASSNSYCLGLADGLYQAAKDEKKLEESRAKQAQPGESGWRSHKQLVQFRESAEKIVKSG